MLSWREDVHVVILRMKFFSELVKIGIPTEHQLDAMLFLIKDPAKMRAFFGIPTSELRQQILLKMMYAKEP